MRHGWTLATALVLILIPIVSRGGGPPLPDSRLGIRTAPILLLSRPDVRDDLGLDAKQAAAAERTITDLYIRAARLRGQAEEVARSAREAIDADQRRWLDENLTPAQRGRLAQIDLQWEGPAAVITRPVIAEALGLSADQRRTLSQAVSQRHAQRDRGEASPASERPLAEVVLATLTAEQKNKWKAMLGRPFVVRPIKTADRGQPNR